MQYYDDTYPTAKEQKAFEKSLFTKTHRANGTYALGRDANCSDFIGSFPIFAYPFRYYGNIELSSDFLGDLIIYFLVHFISRLLVEPDDFPVAVIKRRLSLATF